MKKIVAALVVIVIAVIAWLAFGGSNGSNNGTANSSGSGQNRQPAATNSVTIQNFSFNPADIKIKKGIKVTWTNRDSTGHTVTENDGQNGPASQILGNGQSYSFTFNQDGTYHYHCTIHTEMTGTVTVAD